MCFTDFIKAPLAGSRYSAEAQRGSNALSVQFGTEVIFASDHVRVLGVTISSDLFLDKHVANVCSSGFYWLRRANFDESNDP